MFTAALGIGSFLIQGKVAKDSDTNQREIEAAQTLCDIKRVTCTVISTDLVFCSSICVPLASCFGTQVVMIAARSTYLIPSVIPGMKKIEHVPRVCSSACGNRQRSR